MIYFRSISSEILKIRHSSILWVTFLAFALGPIMGGLALYLSASSDIQQSSSALGQKALLMSFTSDWNSYIIILSQVVGVGGVVVFGFVASWLFGREYSDKTAKDLLALPTSRAQILNAKFIIYTLWCFALIISNLIIGVIIGLILGLEGFDLSLLPSSVNVYLLTSFMVIGLGSPISFMAIWGKGYLAPIGFVVFVLVLSQIIAAVGFGQYFPWAVPGLYSGISTEMKASVNGLSYSIVAAVSFIGFIATHFWWTRTDQN